MLIEEGIVVDDRGDNVLVRTERSPECKGCASMAICKSVTDEKGMMVIAENPLHARKGDKVLITVDTRDLLKTSFILYIFPLIFFVMGIVLGEMFGEAFVPWVEKDILATVPGIMMLLVAFGTIRVYGRKWSREKGHLPRISRIVNGVQEARGKIF